MVLYCDYSDTKYTHGKTFYECLIENQNIPENKSVEILGEHMNGKSDRKCMQLCLKTVKLTNFHKALTNIFQI